MSDCLLNLKSMMASLIGLSRGEYSCCCYGRWLDLQASGYKTNFSSNNGNKLYLEKSYDEKTDIFAHTLPPFRNVRSMLWHPQGPILNPANLAQTFLPRYNAFVWSRPASSCCNRLFLHKCLLLLGLAVAASVGEKDLVPATTKTFVLLPRRNLGCGGGGGGTGQAVVNTFNKQITFRLGQEVFS